MRPSVVVVVSPLVENDPGLGEAQVSRTPIFGRADKMEL